MAKAKTDPSDTTLRDNCDICDTARAADKKEALQLAGKILACKILKGKISSSHDEIHGHLGFYRKNLHQGRVFDSTVAIAAIMLSKGERLPEWLAVFVADVLKGTLKRPTKHGKDKFANMERDYYTAWAVLEVSRRFSLPKRTNNALSKKTTAAQIVAEQGKFTINQVHNAYQRYGNKIETFLLSQEI